MTLARFYGHSLALLTDLYQLTMANGYWQCDRRRDEAVFHLFFRRHPFRGGYAVACGLGNAVEFLRSLHFDDDDVAFLRTLQGNDGQPLFSLGFLQYLREMAFTCDVDAVPEGTPVFAHEPLLRIRGPLIQCQLLETALLNIVNFQSLIATKAARICHATGGEPVLEFGLRRAQGFDGSLSASRAAYIGGCSATSNVLAGKLFGIPVRGTHAHSWVMSFADESQSFEAYATAMPNNCVFLVDTYDTLRGVQRAIQVGQRLRSKGHQMLGIRLDSGDLAWLSGEARRLLDEAGFQDAAIVASNNLDEHTIESLKRQHAQITIWGVGTKLVTGYDQPALGGVYKLASLRAPQGTWQHKIKISEQAIKTSIPGHLQIRRFMLDGACIGDMLFDETMGVNKAMIIDPRDRSRRKTLPPNAEHRDLLQPVFQGGRYVGENDTLAAIRERCARGLAELHGSIKRFDNPHEYPVGLESRLHALRANMILEARGVDEHDA